MSLPTPDIFSSFLALSPIISQNDMLETRLDNDSTGKILYVGRSTIPNADPTLPLWYVVKYFYDINGFFSRIELPNLGPGFVYVWNNRSTYF